jgi:hypothetical protein
MDLIARARLADHGRPQAGGIMRDTTAADLIGRVPAPRAYEPMLVTTLRRYQRRGVPASLLTRIAGGATAWRLLNDWWSIDGAIRGRTGARR